MKIKRALKNAMAILPMIYLACAPELSEVKQKSFEQRVYEIWNETIDSYSSEELRIARYGKSLEEKIINEKPKKSNAAIPKIESIEEKDDLVSRWKNDYEIPEDQIIHLRKALEKVKFDNNPGEYSGKTNGTNIKVLEKSDCGKTIVSSEGMASVYSTKSASSKTATGATLDDDLPTIAVNSRLGIPVPALCYVKNPVTNKGIYVLAVDKGPYSISRRGLEVDKYGNYVPHRSRIVDLSVETAEKIGVRGLGKVVVRYIEPVKIKRKS